MEPGGAGVPSTTKPSTATAVPPGRIIRAKGRVVRVSRDNGQDRFPGMGLEFVDLPPEDRVAIEGHLNTDGAA